MSTPPSLPNAASPSLTRIYAWFSALIAEDTDLMADLLEQGLPVDVPHPLRHTTALMEATRLGRTTLVSWLLSHGAAPAFLCGLPRGTPIHCALRRHHWEIAERLLQASSHCSIVDSYSRTPLHTLSMDMPDDEAGQKQAIRLAEIVVTKGCQIDALDHEGITALHYCVINDFTALTHLLLKHGANPNTQTPDTQVRPLTIAALDKNITIAQLLLYYGADPHAKTREGATALTLMPSLKQLAGSVDSPPAPDTLQPVSSPTRPMN